MCFLIYHAMLYNVYYLRSFRVGRSSSSALGTYQKEPSRGCTELSSISTVTSPSLACLSFPAMFFRMVLKVSTELHMWRYMRPSSRPGWFSICPYGIETRKIRGWRFKAFTGGTSCTTCAHIRWERLSV